MFGVNLVLSFTGLEDLKPEDRKAVIEDAIRILQSGDVEDHLMENNTYEDAIGVDLDYDPTEDVDVEELSLDEADTLRHTFNYHLAIVSSSTEIPDLRMDIDVDGQLIIFPYDQEENILSANLTALDEEED